MKRFSILIILLTALVMSSGCAAVGTYFKDRALDFVDCFKADVGFGLGADVHVRLTDAVSGGAGFAATFRVGFKGRHVGSWAEMHAGFPVFGILRILETNDPLDLVREQAVVGGGIETILPSFPGGYNTDGIILVTTKISKYDPRRPVKHGYFEDPVNAFDVELGATALIIGARVGFSPGQFADFLLGWFGLDIAGDDTAALAAIEKENPPDNIDKTKIESAVRKLEEKFKEIGLGEKGWTLLHFACARSEYGVLGVLLGRKETDVDAKLPDGTTAMHLAAKNGDVQIVEILALHGADVNATDAEGSTPLHYACRFGQAEVVKLLAGRKRIDFTIRNKPGRTAKDEALEYKKTTGDVKTYDKIIELINRYEKAANDEK